MSTGALDDPAESEAWPRLADELIDVIARRAARIVLEQLRHEPRQSPYLTIPEAAAYARCKRQRIDDLLSARRLTRYKDGRRTLILRAQLEAHLAGAPGPAARPASDSIFPAPRATVITPGNRTS